MDNKIIEEMANFIHGRRDKNGSLKTAEVLYNAGYRKLPEDSVVLSKEEYEKLKCQAEEDFNKAYDLGNKETAEKFLQLAYDRCLEKSFIKKVEELAKQFGVEIKEL